MADGRHSRRRSVLSRARLASLRYKMQPPRHGDVALHLVHPSVSPGSRRTSPRTSPSASPELFGRPSLLTRAPVGRTSTIFGIAAATPPSASPPLRPNPAGVRRRRHRSSSPARHLAAPPPSSALQRRGTRRPRLRAAAAGCPHRLLAGSGRRRRRPLVIPGFARCGVRPSVKPFLSVVRIHQVCRCSPIVVFVLASASSSLVPAASHLRPRIAAEVVPSPSVSAAPVRRCRSHASSRGGKACSFACVLRVVFVVLEVPEAWFVVVAEGSEVRSL
uniref:Cell wall protein-like n=1 Tax=Oryza sativa subsp. japonica TaxID=39947 RepID=Q69KH8_ORYSJ|nr:cell wall protein-like [Oryza sativa Japonica Group]BAD36562.1 cell wall protein-like [Oryza sativa Japonica Group]